MESQAWLWAQSLHLSPTQMAECWEAYSLNKNTTSLDEHSFAAYRAQLIKISDVDMADAAGAVIVQQQCKSNAIHRQPKST